MEPKPQKLPRKQQLELHEMRKVLHGKRRRLHERLSEVCEEFLLENLTKEHKQRALVRELEYVLDYYRDPSSWEGID